MKMGTIKDLRIALAGVDKKGKPLIGRTYAAAVKKAAGFTSKKFDVDAAKEWLRKNANFKVSDIWPITKTIKSGRRNRKDPQGSGSGSQSEPLSMHA